MLRVVSWEMPLPHRLLGPGTNLTLVLGSHKQQKCRQSQELPQLRDKSCPLSSVLATDLPNKAKDRTFCKKLRWLDSIPNSIDMNLSKLWEIVEDRRVWRVIDGGVAKSQT